MYSGSGTSMDGNMHSRAVLHFAETKMSTNGLKHSFAQTQQCRNKNEHEHKGHFQDSVANKHRSRLIHGCATQNAGIPCVDLTPSLGNLPNRYRKIHDYEDQEHKVYCSSSTCIFQATQASTHCTILNHNLKLLLHYIQYVGVQCGRPDGVPCKPR